MTPTTTPPDCYGTGCGGFHPICPPCRWVARAEAAAQVGRWMPHAICFVWGFFVACCVMHGCVQ